MTEHNDTSGAGEQTLAERLAPMTIAEIDAMSDHDVAEIMSVTPEEFAAEPAWTWREAAKAATDEYTEKLAASAQPGRTRVITDPTEIHRRLGGRPRVGNASGHGPSQQVRVRVTTHTRNALEDIAAAQGRRLARVSRDALDEHIARHAS